MRKKVGFLLEYLDRSEIEIKRGGDVSVNKAARPGRKCVIHYTDLLGVSGTLLTWSHHLFSLRELVFESLYLSLTKLHDPAAPTRAID